jgi:membrane protein involved in colicin uptake
VIQGARSASGAGAGASGQADPAFALWAKQVRSALQAHFEPPNDAGDVSCVVRIRVDTTSGAVESYELTVSSGILAFDAATVRAVEESRSVPLPPDHYRGILDGVAFSLQLDAK